LKKISNNKKSLQTIGEMIKFAAGEFKRSQIFFGHGTDNEWDEAVYLVLFSLGLEQHLTDVVLNRNISDKEQQLVLAIIEKRIADRIPSAYLTKEAYFAGFKFYVDQRTLIPRSPIADLILNKFNPWIIEEKVRDVLEIGTGSGCIAISCAYLFPRARISATDIDTDALRVAQLNCAKHRVKSRVKLICSDLFSNISSTQRYDIIISNPPYVGEKEFKKLPREYSHEPKLALLAGSKGYELIVRILAEAAKYLKPQGLLIIEMGNSAHRIARKYPQLPFVWLDFEHGDSEVLLITREQLINGILFP
jgi:ribosomal protein L3 glutamine methyltransferase